MAEQYQEESEARGGLPLPGSGRGPLVTWSLLAANVLIWIAMESSGGSEESDVLLDFGAMLGPLIANGEYWRLFTAMFLHVGLMHLLFNSLGLFIFGRLVERIYGPVQFAVIYVVAGLSGSVASYTLNPIAIGAGASGAIFGVLGALAAFFVARRDVLGKMGRQHLSGIWAIAAINLFFGFVTPGIDNWAHMGGFVAGFAIGLAFVPQYQMVSSPFGIAYRLVGTNSLVRRWWVFPVAAAVLIGGARAGTATLPDNALTHVYSAQRHLEDQTYDEALEEIGRALRLEPGNGLAYYVRGKIFVNLGDAARARGDLFRAFGLAVQAGDRETVSKARELLASLP